MAFAAATAVQQKDSHTYTANFSGDWVIGSVPHGGYVTSIFQQVVRKHFDTTLRKQNQPHTLALHLEFLRRTDVGPATFVVRDVKLGRQLSIVHVTLSQGDREEIIGYVTNTNLVAESGTTIDTHWSSRAGLSGIDVSSLEDGSNSEWQQKKHWPNVQFRKATKHLQTWFPRNGQPNQSGYDFWSCPADASEKWTNESLGYLVDLFPQVIDRHLLGGLDPYSPELDSDPVLEEKRKKLSKDAPNYWYPTVLLNLDVKKALPEDGVRFLFTRVQAKQIKNGRYDLEVAIMDPQGELVALSHHICLALSAERNVAARRKTDGKL